jgi:hypothetical protein
MTQALYAHMNNKRKRKKMFIYDFNSNNAGDKNVAMYSKNNSHLQLILKVCQQKNC